MSNDLQSIPLQKNDGTPTTLADYRGRVLLVVNTASKCGLTPQYEGLEKLHEAYGAQGFSVLGFPCNQFLGQEPGSDADIQQFCTMKFDIKFPIFKKLEVNGPNAHPLYRLLKESRPVAEKPRHSMFAMKLRLIGQKPKNEGDILWNFEKFLIDRTGKVVARFAPDVKPTDPLLITALESALKSPQP